MHPSELRPSRASYRAGPLFGALALVLAAFAVMLVGGRAIEAAHPGTTVFVDGNVAVSGDGTAATPYKTIQEGVDHAAVGDTVQVAAATYTENVTIDSALTLNGAVGAIISGSSAGSVGGSSGHATG